MSSRTSDHDAGMKRARLSLAGLSVGDAFGARFSGPYSLVHSLIQSRSFPQPPWPCTEQTRTAASVVDSLDAGTHPIRLSRGGKDSQVFSAAAPLGGYHAGNVDRAVETVSAAQAQPECREGAIAVAAAAALASSEDPVDPLPFLERVVAALPNGRVRDGLVLATTLRDDAPVLVAAATLGNGANGTAADSVPFALWCVSRFRHSYPEALWQTVSPLGGRAPMCAIVGGIVALSSGRDGIPEEWMAAREPIA